MFDLMIIALHKVAGHSFALNCFPDFPWFA